MNKGNLLSSMEESLRQVIPDYDRRNDELKRTEWQRWIPALSVYRSLAGDHYDGLVLSLKHPPIYEFANVAYILAQIVAIGCGAAVVVGSLDKIIEKLV